MIQIGFRFDTRKTNMWHSDEIADQITGRNDDKLGIPITNLEVKFCQMFILYFNSVQ